MNRITGNNKFMQLEIWILKGKDYAMPKSRIIESLGYDGRENPVQDLYDLIKEYQQKTRNQVCWNEYGELYFAKNQEELDEFRARMRDQVKAEATKLVPKIKILQAEGILPPFKEN